MFATLLESRRTVTWPVGNGALSVAAHGAVVALAVGLTSGATAGVRRTDSPSVPVVALRYVTVAPPPAAAPPGAGRAARARRMRELLTAPQEVPETIPDPPADELTVLAIDELARLDDALTSLVSRAGDFIGMGERGGLGASLVVARHDPTKPYYASEVERMAAPYDDNPRPRYPAALLHAQLEGDVVVQFVIDSTGSADPRSLRVLRSSHELFTRAVRAVVPKLRFLPAEVAGSRVQVLVEQPFKFSLRSN